MAIELELRRTVHTTVWILGAGLVIAYVATEITKLQSREINYHVRGYAELTLHVVGMFGISALLQAGLCFRPIKWLRSASRMVSVLILAATAFWILFAAYTGTITSEPWLFVAGFVALLLASLWDLLAES